jgi:hypothetical protein
MQHVLSTLCTLHQDGLSSNDYWHWHSPSSSAIEVLQLQHGSTHSWPNHTWQGSTQHELLCCTYLPLLATLLADANADDLHALMKWFFKSSDPKLLDLALASATALLKATPSLPLLTAVQPRASDMH